MTNMEKYKQAFVEGLEISDEGLETLKYEAIPEWDSVGHMNLVACLEDVFDIMMILLILVLLKRELRF